MLEKTVFVSNTCSINILKKFQFTHASKAWRQTLWSFQFHWTSIYLSETRGDKGEQSKTEKSYLHT